MKSSKEIYEKRKSVYTHLFEKQTKVSNYFSNLRLLVMTIGVIGAIFLYLERYYYLFVGLIIATFILFIYLIVKHEKLNQRKEYASLLSEINKDSVKRCNGEWSQFPDDGKEFIDENHSYSNDLDIFGTSSLFQWINTAKTYIGRNLLKTFLTQHPMDMSSIVQRQKAVEELAGKLRWRQRFLAEELIVVNKMHNPEELIQWVNVHNPFYRKFWVIFLIRALPSITVLLLLLEFATGKIPNFLPAIFVIVQFILLAITRKEREKVFQLAKKYKEDINVYYRMIKRFEKHKFSTDYLNELKSKMRNSKNLSAYEQMDKLFKIIESLNNRGNAFYFVINILTLWDYQNLIALEKWKEMSGRYLRGWLEGIGNAEALASLSILRFDHSEWTIPSFDAFNECIFEAKSMGHPLLTGQRINNNLQILLPIHTILITGSNMSGKSTLLRAAGINLVLAYAGAPVCAEFFHTSLMQIHTCMRVSDNLGKNISSFYAELLRIKTIVQEAVEGKNVFYLLDEVFKGTNSRDRHLGAKVLIQKLCNTKSIGMVSTHDLELCVLENENKAVKNYHFREYYKDNMIYFDYKLRNGASTTRNAIFLMKLAGIDVDEKDK